MSIERKLRDMPVHSSKTHKQILRSRLLAHMEEIPMKKQIKSLAWARWAGAAMAIALIVAVGVAFMPKGNDSDNPQTQIAKQLFTPQQVFAEAAKMAEENARAKIYYQKVKSITQALPPECKPHTSFLEYWLNTEKNELFTRHSTAQGVVLEDVHYLDGRPDYVYRNEEEMKKVWPERSDKEPPTPPCELLPSLSAEEEATFYKQFHDVPTDLGEDKGVTSTLATNPDPRVQAEAFKQMQQVTTWQLKRDVYLPEYSKKPLVELSFQVQWAYRKLYFDQATGRFTGEAERHPSVYMSPYMALVIEQHAVADLPKFDRSQSDPF